MLPTEFAERLLSWFQRHGRHDLPWQHPRTPYRVWLAEIMLQQTQVGTVIPYFQRFVAALPGLPELAAASEERVLALWSGLGYYRRARYLHQAARRCVERHGGELPDDMGALQALPGIGRSTAAAICAQAFGRPEPILDGNVKRVLCRLFAVQGWPGEAQVQKRLWALAEQLMPSRHCADYTQAIMDLGATLCTRAQPNCAACPLSNRCRARLDGSVDSLPAARPQRPSPWRECVMLVLQDAQGRVLMQRRDGPGVWQGLWSLPQFEGLPQASERALTLGAETSGEPLTPIEHAFTHYRLRIQPWRARCPSARARIGDNPALRWISRAELPDTGIPAPVRRLLEQLKEFH
jgi:A/G-specific adenine glycosylase